MVTPTKEDFEHYFMLESKSIVFAEMFESPREVAFDVLREVHPYGDHKFVGDKLNLVAIKEKMAERGFHTQDF